MKTYLAGLVLAGAVYAAPAEFELFYAQPEAQRDLLVEDLVRRQLPDLELYRISESERYRRFPQFVVAACSSSGYFLLAHGQRLIATGCLERTNAADEIRRMQAAIVLDRRRNRDGNSRLDAALAAAAAGERAAARTLTTEAENSRAADRTNLNRLKRILR